MYLYIGMLPGMDSPGLGIGCKNEHSVNFHIQGTIMYLHMYLNFAIIKGESGAWLLHEHWDTVVSNLVEHSIR